MTTRPPNLLLVFADQLRCDLGCYGNADVRTPHLDALAGQGVRLTRATANAPVCGPCRAMMMTGTFSTTNGVIGNDLPVRTGGPSLGTSAKANGCRAGYVGKWHLDGVPRDKFTPPGPRRLGFDDFWAAYNCSHDYFSPVHFRGDDPTPVRPGGRGGEPSPYEPAVQTDLAIEFLNGSRAGTDDRPFALAVSWGPPHDPYPQVPERYRRMYDPAEIRLRPNARPDADNPLAAGKDCRRTTADYYAAITALDDQFGRLMAALDDAGHAHDTLVVFTSDHGDLLWSHGLMKKQSPYAEAVGVPLIARLPGSIPAGTATPVLLGLVDLLPTLAGLLGWAVPGGVEGTDLSASVRGDAGAAGPASALIADCMAIGEASVQGLPPWRGVRTATHTYAERLDDAGRRVPWLLFDDAADPYQLDNRIDSPADAATRDALRRELDGWLDRTADPFLPPAQMVERLGLQDVWQAKCRMQPE